MSSSLIRKVRSFARELRDRKCRMLRRRIGSGVESLEPRYLLADARFQLPLLEVATGSPADSTLTYQVGDWTADGTHDLFSIKTSGTASGKVEVKVYSGETGFAIAPYSYVTSLGVTNSHWQYRVADFDGAGNLDLIAINRAGSSGKTEVTVLTGESSFLTSHKFVTALGNSAINWTFDVIDVNRDGQLDLFGIQKYGSSTGKVELHVMTGVETSPGQRFQAELFGAITAFPANDLDVAYHTEDMTNNNSIDLFAIRRNGVFSSRVEVISASGSGGTLGFYSNPDPVNITPLLSSGIDYEFQMIDFKGGTPVDDGIPDLVAFAKSGPGLTSTRVQVLSGIFAPLGDGATIGFSACSTQTAAIAVPPGFLNIGLEPGCVIKGNGAVVGQPGSTVTYVGTGTVQQAAPISVGQLAIEATVQVVNAAVITAPGDVTVHPAGTLILGQGTSTAPGTDVEVKNGGTIGGNGVVNDNLAVGEPAAPGSLAILAPGSSAGRLTAGALTLHAGGKLVAEIKGNAAGTNYDQVVTQSVVLNNARLETQATFKPEAGAEFILIRNDGASAVTGNFVDSSGVVLLEGAIIDNNFGGSGRNARISYAGGDGNDVVAVVDGPFTFVSPPNSQADDITVRQSGGVIQFLVNGKVVRARTAAGLTKLTVIGESGFSDQLSVDFGGGNPIPGGGLVFNAGTDTNDTVSLGSFTADAVNHTFNASGYNRVDIVNGSVTSTLLYVSQLPIYEAMTAASRTFTLTEQDDSISLEGDTAGLPFTRLYYGQRYFEFPDPTISLVIQGRGGKDTVYVASLSPQFAAALTIDGGSGTDNIQISPSLTGLASLALTAESTSLSGTTYETVGGQTYTGNVSLLSNVVFSTSGTAALTFFGTVNGARDIVLNVPGTTTFVGAIGDTTAIGDATGSALRINSSGITNFANAVRLASGIVQADTAGRVKFDQNVTITGNAAGSSLQGQVILDGMTFQSVGPVTFGNAATDQLILSGGPVTIDTANTSSIATVNAVISGSQNFIKAGLGTLLLKTPAIYIGSTTVQGGTLKLGAADLLPNGTTVSVSTGANVNLAGFNETIAALTGSGATLLGVGTLTVSGTVNATYAGAISGPGNVLKRGANRWTVTGNNTYTGWTKVEVGSLEVNGTIGGGAPAGQVSILANAELRGFGAINASSLVSTGGTLYPTGALEAPNTNLDSASTFKVDLGLSKLVVTGTATLQTPRLTIGPAAGYVHVPGKDTAIIENDGTEAIVGQFASFPQGTSFNFGPEKFSRLLYRSANPTLVNDVYAHAMLISASTNVATATVTDFFAGTSTDIATDARGNYVIAWPAPFVGVNYRLYDAHGIPRSPVKLLTLSTETNHENLRVAMDASGNFIISDWISSQGLVIQRFDAVGQPIGGPTAIPLEHGVYQFGDIAMAGDGRFVVTWQQWQDGLFNGIYARRFTADGIALDVSDIEIAILPQTNGIWASPRAAINDSGEFVVSWAQYIYIAYEISARRYSANGVPKDAQPFVVSSTNSNQSTSVAITSKGETLFATLDQIGTPGTSGDYLTVHRYRADGMPLGSPIVTDYVRLLNNTSLAVDAEGNFAVTGHVDASISDAAYLKPFLSIYNRSGVVIRNKMPLGTGSSTNEASILAMARDGSIAITTSSYNSYLDPIYIRTRTVNERSDAVLRSIGTNNATGVDVRYDIDNGPVGPIGLNFYRSSDAVFDSSDILLAATTLSDSADLTRGSHTKTYAVGSGPGQIPLPTTSTDYYLLAVLDPGDFLYESDVSPITEDNVARYFVHFNRPPVLAGVPATRTYVENANRILLAPAGTVTDPDSGVPGYQDFGGGQLSVTITAGANANDRLTVVHQGTAAGQIGVSGSNVSFGGTVIGSFTGGVGTMPLVIAFNNQSSASAAQALLRAIAFESLSNNPSTAPRTLRIALVDGDGGTSNMPSTSITVIAVNDAPIGANKSLTTNEDTPLTIVSAHFGFTDVDGHAFSRVRIGSVPSAGVLKLNGVAIVAGAFVTKAQLDANQLIFYPAANANGTASAKFTFQVQDNGGTANGGLDTDLIARTLTFNITAINDAPVRTAGTLTPIIVNEDSANITAITLGLTALSYAPGPATATNEISQTLTYTVSAIPAFIRLFKADGITAVNAGATVTATELKGLKYKTVANANGTGNIVLTIRDNGSGTAPQVNTLVENLAITVTAINDAPVRTAGTFTPIIVNEDSANTTAITLGLTALTYAPGPATASNETSQTLTYTISVIPTFIRLFKGDGVTAVNAAATVSATELKALRYKTVANANGTGNIVLTIRDNGSGTAPQVNTLVENLAITVTAINDAPVRTAGTFTPIIVNEDSANTTAITLGLTALTYAPGPATATNETSQTLTYTISAIPAFIRLFKGDGITAVNAGATVTATELKALRYKTVANANGTGKIVLTIRDNGSGTAPHVNTLVENLAVMVKAV